MLLEIDENELLGLLQDRLSLDSRVNEAIHVLELASKGEAAGTA